MALRKTHIGREQCSDIISVLPKQDLVLFCEIILFYETRSHPI